MRTVMDEKDNAAAVMEVNITITECNSDLGKFRAVMPLGVDKSYVEYGETRQIAADKCAVGVMKLIESARNDRDKMAEEWQAFRESAQKEYMPLPHIANDRDFSLAVYECDKLLTSKGHDYTQGAEGDYGRLKNFYTGAEYLGLTPLQVLGVYFKKHIDAVFTFIKKGQVESEPIEGRIYDCINYLLLLYKMVSYEKRKNTVPIISPSTLIVMRATHPTLPAVQQAVVDNQGLVK